MKQNAMDCPVCGQKTKTVKTTLMTPHVKEITYSCQNSDCLHSFVATLEVSRTIHASLLKLSPQPIF
ncbi:MAG: ogr/Delta-like zinc finger family protein [Rhodospirillaceae bacterium]